MDNPLCLRALHAVCVDMTHNVMTAFLFSGFRHVIVDIVPMRFQLGDPMINGYYAVAIGAATQEEVDTITKYAFMVNDVLKEYFAQCGIELVDFKIEFGRYHGQIILADEISPDTCRLWDINTHEKLDKDRFRRDLGGVEDAYQEVFKRLGIR